MPIYEYQCDSCNFHFEEKQGFDDEPIATCPRCKGPVHRVFQSAPIIFKGSGFYITDSRQDSDVESETAKEKPPDKGEPKEKPPDKEGPKEEPG